MIQSKPHIWPTISVIIMIFCCVFFAYIFFNSIFIDKPLPVGLFIILGLFSSLAVWTLILGIYFFKIITISSEHISIYFPFRCKKYKYKFSELKSHCTFSNSGRFKDYESLHFQTSDMRIFMINQYEYWNYKKIKDVITSSSENGEISKYHNGRKLLIFFALSIIFTFGAAVLLELMNKLTFANN
jgi:hypothetical protein